MNRNQGSNQNELQRIAGERDTFLQFLLQFPEWKEPTIDAFGHRIADIAKGQKIQPPINFCEYLHYGVSRAGLDPAWAKVAAAIQFSLGKTAREQIQARYSALAKFPKSPIFMCHASEDKALVRKHAAMLYHVGYSPWLDERDLVAGQDWDAEIRRSIKQCFAFVVFISPRSHKLGYVQEELGYSLDEADRQPAGRIFLIPAKLEPCLPPDRLSHLHWVDLFADDGFFKLCQALRVKQAQES